MSLPREQVRAMCEEMGKIASPITQLARAAARSPLRGALLGGGGGAALGAGKELTKAPEERNFLRGAIRGGLAGAAVGGAVGGTGRALSNTAALQRASGKFVTPGSVVRGTASRLGAGLKDFGKRQIHGATGAYKGSLTDPLKRKQQILSARMEGATGKELKSLTRQAKDTAQELSRREDALKAGITHVPGLAKGLVTKPGETAKALYRQQAGGAGRTGAVVGLGLPLALAAPDLARGDESAAGGRSIKQKLVGHGTNLGIGFATGGLPLVPQMIVGDTAFNMTAKRKDR